MVYWVAAIFAVSATLAFTIRSAPRAFALIALFPLAAFGLGVLENDPFSGEQVELVGVVFVAALSGFMIALLLKIGSSNEAKPHRQEESKVKPAKKSEKKVPQKRFQSGPKSSSFDETEDKDNIRLHLNDAIQRQRNKVGRLVAGNVQLMDLEKLFHTEGKPPPISRTKAMEISVTIAERYLSPADIMVRQGDMGLIFLFDDATQTEIEAKTEEISEAISYALEIDGYDNPFATQSFSFDLEDFLEGSVIDTVDDLIRLVKLAHESYMAKQYSFAEELKKAIRLEFFQMVDPVTFGSAGPEIRAFEGLANDPSSENITQRKLSAADGSEQDCVVLEKLLTQIPSLRLSGKQKIYLPVRFETLSNPLFADNYFSIVKLMAPENRKRVIFCLITSRSKSYGRAPGRIAKVLAEYCGGMILLGHIKQIQPTKIADAGFTGVGLTFPLNAKTETSEEDIKKAIVGLQKQKLSVVLFGAAKPYEILTKLKIPYSPLRIVKK